MAGNRFRGPQCRYRLLTEIDGGTLCRETSPPPGPTGHLSLWPELSEPDFLPAALGLDSAITDADKAEFKIIRSMQVLDSSRRVFKNVRQYVSTRTVYFGGPAAYMDFASESDDELANTKWGSKRKTRTLRSMIDFGKKGQAEKQKLFYRWVRRAYQHKYGDDVDVPEIIRKGMSDELAKRIQAVRGSIRVKSIHDEGFHAGGFNPRPIKYQHDYLLGTLSEHATGMAVDIDDNRNPQLTLDEWKFIEDLVGEHVVRTGRWDSEDDAEDLWNDIKDLSDGFVTKVAAEVKRIEKERADKERKEKELAEKEKADGKPVSSHHNKAAKVLTPLQEILGGNYKSLSPWVSSGFFQLPLELVLELQAHGFTWGATFSTNVDLHHFELD